MSNATRLVVVETSLTPRHEALLGLLSSDPSPGMAAMRRVTGLKTDRGVQLLVRRLVEHGWISVTESGGGRGNRAVYKPRKTLNETPNRKGEKPRTETPKDPRPEPCARPLPSFDFDLKDQAKDLKPSLVQPDGFDRFWDAYRCKRESKPRARLAWKKLTHSEREAAIAGVPLDSRLWTRAREYVPLPATWLNERRWEDELVTSYAPPQAGPEPEEVFVLDDAVRQAEEAFRARQAEASRARQAR